MRRSQLQTDLHHLRVSLIVGRDKDNCGRDYKLGKLTSFKLLTFRLP